MNDRFDMTRRTLLQSAAAVTLAAVAPAPAQEQPIPWYKRTLRWGQTNITEMDPARYDIPWWRGYWKRTAVQGVIINAGGIVAYYPSKFPLHHRAIGLGDRDLYGELARAAHDDGLAVLARMDSNRAHEDFYKAHPDWFAVDFSGHPYKAGDLYVACINGPYYEQYLPDVMREIIERSHPEGFTDNSWSGLDRGSICHCANCARKFHDRTGKDLPRRHDWDDPVYRQWIQWSYDRRIELWDQNNRVTQAAGGKDCLWIGMNSGSISGQCRSFRDYQRICERAQIIMLDHQSRSDNEGFQGNAIAGKVIHGILGWDKLIPESMPMYQMGRPTFRLSAKPPAEARMWMLAGFAGGIQPWWHHVGAYHEDRRAYLTAEPVMKWHRVNQEYLVNRTPVATVGVVWSQRNTDYFGRDNADELVDQPWRGFTQALVRARIPFIAVNADRIDGDSKDLAVLILPNLGAMSDNQIQAVRKFVQRGGALIATGQTSLFDQNGDPRSDFALAELFGVSGGKAQRPARISEMRHTYLRLPPELNGQRHPMLAGFGQTDILPFGGTLDPLKVSDKAKVLATFIPPFPMFPPETAWMRTPKTDIPALIVNGFGTGRVVYLPADIDRRFALDNLPDHGNLLANIVRWAANGNIPLQVRGRGLIDCELYRQEKRLILHIVNLTSAATWRAPVDELIPIGPLEFKIRLPEGFAKPAVKALVAPEAISHAIQDGQLRVEIPSVMDHEVLVIEA